jgi:hypothetical protein
MRLPAHIKAAVKRLQEEAALGASPAALYCWPTPFGQEADAVVAALRGADVRLVCVPGTPLMGDWKPTIKRGPRLHVWAGVDMPDWLDKVTGVVFWIGPNARATDTAGTSLGTLWPPHALGSWHSAPTTPLLRITADARMGVLLERVDRMSSPDLARWSLVANCPSHCDWIVYTCDRYYAGLLKLWADVQYEGGKLKFEFIDGICTRPEDWQAARTKPRIFVFYEGKCMLPPTAVNPIFICWQHGKHAPVMANVWTCLFTWGGTRVEELLVLYSVPPPSVKGW